MEPDLDEEPGRSWKGDRRCEGLEGSEFLETCRERVLSGKNPIQSMIAWKEKRLKAEIHFQTTLVLDGILTSL